MLEGNPCIFQLLSYDDVSKNTRVLNTAQLEHFFWLKIPTDVAQRGTLFDIHRLEPTFEDVQWIGQLDRQNGEEGLWLRLPASVFSTTEGFYLYRLKFFVSSSYDVTTLYFSYRIQNNNPERPYDYMGREGD